MPVDVRPLRVRDNADILNAIRADASLEYQRRIPAATSAGISETMENLTKYRAHFNEFVDSLVNRIGLVLARNTNWTNPLAEFKRGMLTFGDTIEEIQVGLLKAHSYDPDREYMERDIFGTEIPDVQTNFHTVNRQDWYKISIREPELRRAFLQENGLSDFITKLMDAPSNSDQWDEFLLTCSLFSEYERNGGFYHVNVPDVARIGSDAADAKVALRKMRAMADTLTFLSTRYNAARMPTFAKRDDLALFVTPEFNAAIDVEALAGAFNLSKSEMHGRIVPIPAEQFQIKGAQAVMTTRDFFVIADQALETTSQFNPVSRQNNYFLHHWQVISASRFVPAVMFWTGPDDEVIHVSHETDSVTEPEILAIGGVVPESIDRGNIVALTAKAITDPLGGPSAVKWSVSGGSSSRTYITATGVLHCGGDETATSLTVTAESVYVDPSNPRATPKSATLTVPVSGPNVTGWPLDGELSSITIDGVPVAGVKADTVAYSLALPSGATVTRDTVVVGMRGPGVLLDVTVSEGESPVTHIVEITFDPGTPEPVLYTVNVTVGS